MMLFGQVYLELGDLEQAGAYLDRALKACYPVENVWYGPPRASIIREQGKLAALKGDDAAAAESYREALDLLVRVARGFQWNTRLRYDLAAELEAAGEPFAALLKEQGREAEAAAVLDRCKAAQVARDFLKAGTPTSSGEARQALSDYRGATTYLDTLRFDLYWNAGVGMGRRLWPWEAYWTMSDFPWRYRREYVRQYLSLRKELEAKIARVEGEAAAHLARLRQLDPATAAVVELEATEPHWRSGE